MYKLRGHLVEIACAGVELQIYQKALVGPESLEQVESIVQAVDIAFSALFTFDVLLRVAVLGKSHLPQSWHIFHGSLDEVKIRQNQSKSSTSVHSIHLLPRSRILGSAEDSGWWPWITLILLSVFLQQNETMKPSQETWKRTWKLWKVVAFDIDCCCTISIHSSPGVASMIELTLSRVLTLPVPPILFRLLRMGKLARAFRMVSCHAFLNTVFVEAKRQSLVTWLMVELCKVTMTSVLGSLQLLVKCLAASSALVQEVRNFYLSTFSKVFF